MKLHLKQKSAQSPKRTALSLDMTRGNLWKQIILFSLPLMFSNVLQVLFNLADIAVVGRFAGAAALGSVGSTTTLVALYTGFLIGTNTAINVLTAQSFGADREKDVEEYVHTGLIVSLMTGVLIWLAGSLSLHSVLALLGTKEELIEGAEQYLSIYLMGMPALSLFNYGNAVYSAIGNTRKPLYLLSLAGIVNVFLNLLFVIRFHMDVTGVAAASIIAQYLSAALILSSLHREQDCFGLRWKKIVSLCAIRKDKVIRILELGIPSGCQFSIFQIANLFIQGGVNTFPAIVVEGNAAAANADALVYDLMGGIYTACASFMGQNYGAGKRDRMRKTFVISTIYSVGIGAVAGFLLVVFGKPFLRLFTTESAVVEAGLARLTIMGLSYAVSAVMDNTIAASRGLGRSLVPTIIVIMGSCVFRVIWVYTIFAWFGTITSLYLLYVFSWSLTGLAEVVYFLRVYRRYK